MKTPFLKISKIYLLCIVSGIISLSANFTSRVLAQGTAVSTHGQLRIQGNRVVDKNNQPYQLRGMSLYWSQWKPAFYNATTVRWLRDDWCVNVVRAAMAEGSGGYSTNPTAERNKVIAVVDAAIALGIYVVIDYHSHTAHNNTAQARAFFLDMATRYKNVPNVIYEPFNEPLAVSWTGVLKPYFQTIITAIRSQDPDNIIVCGTPNWSQRVADAAASPLTGTNIAYTAHYYAATHGQWLRTAVQSAMNAGICVMVTEYGTCAADGSGAISTTESNAWWTFMKTNFIGHMNWSVADLGETSAVIPTGTGISNWSPSILKPSGTLVRNYLRTQCETYPRPTAVDEENGTENVATAFPNPFNEDFTIRSRGQFTYEITNMTGTVVETGEGVESVNAGSTLPEAMYIVRVITPNGDKMIKVNKAK